MPDDPPRLLVVTYHFPPDGSVGGLRWAGITKYLTRLGWQVAVVTAAAPIASDPAVRAHVEWCPRRRTLIDYYRRVRRPDDGSDGSSPNGTRLARSARPGGLLGALRTELAAFLAFPDESRGWTLRAARRARALVRRFHPQVVVSSGPPHSAHLVARLATIGQPVRWLIDLRDPWAGPHSKAWESHPVVQTRLFGVLVPRLERLTVRAADGVIANTPQLAAVLSAKYPKVPVHCVPNGVDAECLPPARHPYPGLSIIYAGTLYGSRDLGPVVQAFRGFLERHPEAAQAGSKLRIAGHAEASSAAALGEQVTASGLGPYVEVLGAVPRAQALDLIARSRLAVVLAQEQELQTPAKLYECIAMGIPALVVAEPGSAAGVEGTRLGAAVFEHRDVAGIGGVLEHLWRDGSQQRARRPAPVTYDTIAPLVDRLLREPATAPLGRTGRVSQDATETSRAGPG